MLYLLANIEYRGRAIGGRVYSSEDKKFRDIGGEAYYNSVKGSTELVKETDYTQLPTVKVWEDYIGFCDKFQSIVVDNIEKIEGVNASGYNTERVIQMYSEVGYTNGESVGVTKIVTYDGRELVVSSEALFSHVKADRNSWYLSRGLPSCSKIINAKYTAAQVDCSLSKSNPLYRAVLKENALATRTLTLAELMGETILVKMLSNESNIIVPKGVTMIMSKAFIGCKNMKSVELPEGLKFLSYAAFKGTQTKEFEMPRSLRAMYHEVFPTGNPEPTNAREVVMNLITF